MCGSFLQQLQSPVLTTIFNPSVCLCGCVCLSASIFLEPLGWSARNFFPQIPHGRGSVLFWQHCATLCTSSYMYVTFGRNGPCGDAWPAWSATSRQLRARLGGVWCLWMTHLSLWKRVSKQVYQNSCSQLAGLYNFEPSNCTGTNIQTHKNHEKIHRKLTTRHTKWP